MFHIELLPPEVLVNVFQQLDVKSICHVTQVKHQWYELVNDNQGMWNLLCLRDFPDFMNTLPIFDPEKSAKKFGLQLLSDLRHHKGLLEFLEEFVVLITQSVEIEEKTWQKKNWKEYYIECFKKINLSGVWIGDYGGHGEEEVQINHKGYHLEAIKITGDPNVPSGKTTFKMKLGQHLKHAIGEIHLADHGYINPRWSEASMIVIDSMHFYVIWRHYDWIFPMRFRKKGCEEEVEIIPEDNQEEDNSFDEE